jgi:putative spermidine/putrescine transport system permease protein
MKHSWKLLYLLATAVPLIAGLGYSFLYSVGLTGALGSGFTFEHWNEIFKSGEIITSLIYTLLLSVVSISLGTFGAGLIAYGWYKEKIRISRAFMLPMAMAPVVAAFAMNVLLSPSGFFSRMVFQLGLISDIQEFPRMVNDRWSVAIVLTHIFLMLPILSILMYNVARKERMNELEESAVSLGAGQGQFLRSVFLPLVIRKSLPVLVLYAVFVFGTYEIPLVLGRQSPRAVTVFITDKLTRFNLLDIPQGHVMILIYALLVGGIAALLVRKQTSLW